MRPYMPNTPEHTGRAVHSELAVEGPTTATK